MSLYGRIEAEGLSHDQQRSIFRDEMLAYRNALHHLGPEWEQMPMADRVCDAQSNARILEAIWQCIAEEGLTPGIGDEAYLRATVPDLEPIERHGLRLLLTNASNFEGNFANEVDARLSSVGTRGTDFNRALASRLVAGARAMAAREYREGAASEHMYLGLDNVPASSTPLAHSPTAGPLPVPQPEAAISVPAAWLHLSAQDIATSFIASNPRMFKHRAGGKRETGQTGEQSERQLMWAATLLDRSMNGRPFWTRTKADMFELDKHFDRLPVNFGKSPTHHDMSYSLERAEDEAVTKLEAGEIDATSIGFTVGTSNKHFRCIARIDRYASEAIPNLPLIDFGKYQTAEVKHERDLRHRISSEQAISLFSLPPWVGCASESDRLSPGTLIVHDGLFWALLLVWYTGARREEICKLMVADVDQLHEITFLRIENTEAGRVKNKSAVRVVAICEELTRIGFMAYVDQMKAAGEKLLFPEFMPGGSTKRKLGDVFYKLWWIYLAPLVSPPLIRGQAMHSCRHAVSDALKAAEIFLETRNDLLGHTGTGGEGETRYPSPTALAKLKGAVDLIPVVSAHLPRVAGNDIQLLSADLRVSRPSRTMK